MLFSLNSLVFKNICLLTLELNDILAGYNILGHPFLPSLLCRCCSLEIILVVNAAMEKPKAILIFPVFLWSVFLFGSLKTSVIPILSPSFLLSLSLPFKVTILYFT